MLRATGIRPSKTFTYVSSQVQTGAVKPEFIHLCNLVIAIFPRIAEHLVELSRLFGQGPDDACARRDDVWLCGERRNGKGNHRRRLASGCFHSEVDGRDSASFT